MRWTDRSRPTWRSCPAPTERSMLLRRGSPNWSSTSPAILRRRACRGERLSSGGRISNLSRSRLLLRHLTETGFGSFLLLVLWRIAFLAHGLATHFDAVGVVNQTVQDAIGDGGIADLLVPARDRQLGSKDGGTSLIAIFADLPDFAALVFIQWRHGPVINDQNIDAAQSSQEVTQASIGPCQGQFTQQGGSSQIESRVAVATGFLCQGRSDKALAHASRTQYENVLVLADPGRVFCQSTHYRLVQATRRTIVDVLHAGRSPQLGRFQSSRQRLVLAPTPLLIDQQSESFKETQLVDRSILLLRFQAFDHALQPHGQQLFHHRLVQHDVCPPWSK